MGFRINKAWILVLMLLISCAAVSAAITDGVSAWWVMQNTTPEYDPLYDFSGNDHNLTTVAAPAFINNSEGYRLDGSNDYLVSDVDEGSSSFTVSGWVNADDLSTQRGVVSSLNLSTTLDGFVLFFVNAAQLRVQTFNNNVKVAEATTSFGAFSNGKWYNLALVYNGSSGDVFIYVDGTLRASDTGPSGTIASWDGGLVLGSKDIDPLSNGFDGFLTDFAVWNRMLSLTEIVTNINASGREYNPYAATDTLTVAITSPPDGAEFAEGNNTFNVTYNGTGSPEIADCALWVDGALNQSSPGINITTGGSFELTVNSIGKNYTLNVVCNHTITANSTTIILYGDTVPPVVDIDDPVNGSNWISGDIPFDCDATDANLYRFNMTVYDRNGTIKYTHEQVNIVGTTATNSTTLPYNSFSASQNLSDWHMLNCTAADAHTGETLTEDVTPEKPALNRVEFPFERGTVTVEVEHSGELEKFDVLQETDRYSFDLGFSKDVSEVVYRIYAHKMTPVVKDDYPCHLVINDDLTGGYWFDAFTSNMERCELTSRGGYYEARVTLKTPQKSLESRSVGELNVVTESVYFTTYTPPVLAVNWSLTCGGKYPTNTHTLNFSGQGLSNCTLLIDGYVYDDWSGDCDAIDIEVPLGWASMTLQTDTVNSSCTVYFDKVNKSLADYAIITILLIIWVVLFICNLTLRGPRGKTIQVLNSLQGLIGVIAGLNFITYSQPVGIAVAVFAAGVWLMLITESGKR